MGKRAVVRPKRELAARFLTSEVRQMEKLLEEGKDDLSDDSFHQKLTAEFNNAPGRAGKKAIQVEQVQSWFRKRKSAETIVIDDEVIETDVTATEVIDSHNSSEELALATETSLSNNAAPESSCEMPEDTDEKRRDQENLEFEAKSARDNAWYDVATFLAHRTISGEPEVRVRYHGFGAEEDEWVNIKKDVRERSIPLESSECRLVEVGDHVLCFQERSKQAMYFDAHIVELERKLHDIRGCRCVFVVKYDHDQTKEIVNLSRLCRRPKYLIA